MLPSSCFLLPVIIQFYFCLLEQEEVYEATTKTLINSVINGYNATVFAYGATGKHQTQVDFRLQRQLNHRPVGAGKTHTMLGNDDNPGIMARALDELFRKMESNSDQMLFDVKMSYLEVKILSGTNWISFPTVNCRFTTNVFEICSIPLQEFWI